MVTPPSLESHAARRRSPLIALVAADGVSRVGNALTTIAVPLIALQSTGSALATGLAGVAATAPLIIGGALGGVAVDRLGFRRASIIADVASGATVLAMAALHHVSALGLPALLALVFVSNLLDVPGSTALAAQVPELATLARLPLERVTALTSTVSRSAGMIGAVLAGVLVATVGPVGALYANAVCFAVAVALTMALIPAMAPAPARSSADVPEPDAQALLAGVAFVWHTPLIRALVVLVVITNALDIAALTVFNPLAASHYTADGSALGLMSAAFGAGALIGAAAAAVIPRGRSRHPLFVVLFLAVPVIKFGVLALLPPLPIALAAIALAGLAAGPLNPMIDTVLLREIPGGIRARVLGAIATGVALGMPVGAFLAGMLAEAVPLPAAYAISGALYVLTILSLGLGRRWSGF